MSRHDTFNVSSPLILAVSSLSNSTARHARHDARHVERVVLSGIWAYVAVFHFIYCCVNRNVMKTEWMVLFCLRRLLLQDTILMVQPRPHLSLVTRKEDSFMLVLHCIHSVLWKVNICLSCKHGYA